MDCPAVVNRIRGWVAEQVGNADAEGVVIGLSGGVDSTVMAKILGRIPTMGLVLPCGSDPDDAEWAQDALLSCRREENVELSHVHGMLAQILELYEMPDWDEHRENLALANLKSRLRMAMLYYFANRDNLLVCGTTNKSELMLGYLTKYGDGGVDIEPIADLWKTEVYELARHLGVMQEIIDKPPSAGLWEGQTDRGELGLTYEEMDPMLRCLSSAMALHHDLDEYAAELIQEKPSDARVLNVLVPIVKASQHKRMLPPSCSLRSVK